MSNDASTVAERAGAPELPGVAMNLVRPKAPVFGTVVSNESCMNGKSASFVKHLIIDVTGTPLAGAYRAGQSFGVIPPGTDANGRSHKVRLYSIANPTGGEAGNPAWLSTTPKRLIDEYQADLDPRGLPSDQALFLGVCSNYLCDLKPGDRVALTGPNGKRFVLPTAPEQHNYLFIATGTGIAPFRGMILELLADRAEGAPRIDLIMGVPYATDLLYHDLFERLALNHARFNYHVAISREADGEYVDGIVRRRMALFAPLLADPRTLIYMCGLDGMQHGLFDVLASHDLAAGYVAMQDSPRGPRARPTARCVLEVY